MDIDPPSGALAAQRSDTGHETGNEPGVRKRRLVYRVATLTVVGSLVLAQVAWVALLVYAALWVTSIA